MKDRWINTGFEEDELKPYTEPELDITDQKRIGKKKNNKKTSDVDCASQIVFARRPESVFSWSSELSVLTAGLLCNRQKCTGIKAISSCLLAVGPPVRLRSATRQPSLELFHRCGAFKEKMKRDDE